ncbi:TPM domain-containing protein [Myceligenerans halotolerans]
MTQTLAPPDHPAPDARAGTTSSRRTVLAGVIAGGVLIGLFSAAFAIGGASLTDHAEAGVVGADQDQPSEPTPTGTALLSAKAQAATMQDILPSAMPIVVDMPVTDEAGVLSTAEYERVAEAVAAVEAQTSLRLFVVYLETFDGIPPEDWADATATKSGLTPEELLLAIATADHIQGLSVDVNGPVSSRDHASIIAASQRAVADGDWAGAATEAADAALETQDSGGSPWWTVLALLGVVALGAALAAGWWYLRHRRPGGEPALSADPESQDDQDGWDGWDAPEERGTPVAVGGSIGLGGAGARNALETGDAALEAGGAAAAVPAASAHAFATAAPAAPAWPAAGPAVAAPAVAGPGVGGGPGIGSPEVARPGAAGEPGAARPGAAGPGVGDPRVAGPGTARPAAGDPAAGDPAAGDRAAGAPAAASSAVPAAAGAPSDLEGDSPAEGSLADPSRPGHEPADRSRTDRDVPDDSLSDDELAARVDEVLVTLDDALRTSAQELELARGQSHGGGIHDLEVVLADAAERAQEAFALRVELLSADEASSRDLAHRVLVGCAEASALLDSGTAPLEDLRRLKPRANRLLDETWQRAGELDRRIERAREELSALSDEFPADAVKPVADNAELADDLVDDARRAIDTGRAASAKRDRAFAAAAARSAQNALGQAERLLREAESARADLTDALPRLDKAVASLTQDVADTERIAGGDPQAAMARTTARAALKQVEVTRDTADPFALLARIAAAEAALDRALARHRDTSEIDARAAALVRDTLSRLEVRLRQVDTLITTRRGAVGPDARMRHSEAVRLTSAARNARARADRTAALDLAQRADTHAYQALTAAMRDAAAGDSPRGMPLAGITLTLEGRRGHGAGAGTRGGLLGLLTRSPHHVRTGGIGGGFGGGGFGSGRAV